jgi:predicted Zn-dependent peptidase
MSPRSSERATTLDAASPLSVELANGLRVVALHHPTVHRTALVCYVRVGSRYESAEDNGVSHLLEHMLYRGIPGYRTAHEQALAFESLGGTLSAATGSDTGSLAVSCPPSNFEATLDLFARVYREPLLEGLDVEKRIVREEILEDLDEDGTWIDDYDLLRATAFEGHPLGLPVIGSVAHVDRLGVDRLRRHHARHYVGSGTVIAVVGPNDGEAVLRAVESRFGGVPRGEPLACEAPAPQTEPRLRFVHHGGSQTALRVGFRGGGVHDPDEPATELLVRLLDDGNSTRLYTRICDERGLSYDVSAGYDASDDAGLCDISSEMAHAETGTVFGEALDVVRSLREDGPTAAELAKAKARHRWSLEEMLDDPGELADYFADAALRGYPTSPAARRDQIEAVSSDEVHRAAERLFRRERLSAVVVGLQPRRARVALARLVERFE